MKKSRFQILLLALFMSITMFAQKQVFTGTVVDSNGEPVIGASVVQKGSSNGSITDMDGNFSVNVEPGQVLTISFVGYKTQEIMFAPFARYTFARVGAASFFVDGGFGFGSEKIGDDDADNAWHIGFRPGVSFNISDHVSFVGTVGYLGYRHAEDYNHFGLNANNHLGSVGLFYTF
jgi:hypothetical protein